MADDLHGEEGMPTLVVDVEEIRDRAYRDHRQAVHGFFRRCLGSRQDAEDLTHDTFVRAFGSGLLARLRQPRAYLLEIARNLLRDRIRRRKLVEFAGLEETFGPDVPGPSASPEDAVGAHQQMERLAAVLAGLPPRTREAFILHKFHHLSYREVAAVMGTSEKTVEKQLARGLLECRQAIRVAAVHGSGRVVRIDARRAARGGTP